MVSGPSLRASWICLLLFSGGVCFPSKKDSKHLYSVTRGSSNGSDTSLPLVSLQYEPSADHQKPEPAPQHASSPTGNQFPSGTGTLIVAADWSPSYKLNQFIVSPDSNTPSQVAGDVLHTDPASGTGKKTLISSEVPQSDAATSGDSNVSSGGAAAFSPVLVPPGFMFAAAGNKPPALDFGDGPVPYIGAPEAFNYGPGSDPFRGANKGVADGLDAALANKDFGDRPASFPDRPLVTQPTEGGDSSLDDPADEAGLYAAPATSSLGDGSGSPPGRSLGTRPKPRPESSFYNPTGGTYAAPARFGRGGSGSPPGWPLETRPGYSFYNPTGGSNAAPARFGLGGGSGSPPGRPLETRPGYSFYNPTGGSNAAPATSSLGSGSGSPPGRPSETRPGYSFYNPTDGSNAAPATSSLGSGSGSPPGRPLASQPESSFYNPTSGSFAASATSSLGSGSGSPPGRPLAAQPAEGVDASFYDPTYWLPAPPPHSSRLTQSRNGYQRASVFSNHMRYSPFYPRPQPPPKQTPGGKV
ncbi:pro-resilin-like [Cebidichthys violaceus]|uniref:pro-resilin-like n=1 Tax=Cebidichthys violaceus TaxID=271503 RepID=UPI0035CC1FFC